jgi:hypothetical protein
VASVVAATATDRMAVLKNRFIFVSFAPAHVSNKAGHCEKNRAAKVNAG